jgi:hypothetical protein
MTSSKKRADRRLGVTESGVVITEAVATALAREAEAGYDVDEWKVVRPGRPSLTGAPVETPRVSFRVAPEVRARAAARAEAEGKTVSQLAREALEKYLAAG